MRLRTLVVTLLAAFATGGILVPAVPARAADPAVVPVTVSPGERWQPRSAGLGGVGDTGFVYSLETDPHVATSPQDPGTQPRWHGFDGTDVALDRAATVLGDRLVQPIGSPVESVDWRLVSDVNWSELSVPIGSSYLATTQDGVLIDYNPTNGVDTGQVQLLSWDGGSPTTFTGLDGFSPEPYTTCCPSPHVDAHGAVLTGFNGTWAYVDTSAGQGWSLPMPSTVSEYALGPDTIAWGQYDNTGNKFIATVPRPTSGQALAAVTTRPYPQVSASSTYNYLLPLGTDVLVWPRDGGRYRQEPSPVLAVAPDGSVSTVLAYAHDVSPDGSGGAYAVSGNTPETSAIVHLAAGSYNASPVITITPYPARVHAVALDSGRLVTIDDSDSPSPAATGNATLVQREITGTPDSVSVSAPTELTNDVSWNCSVSTFTPGARCTALAADSGLTAYERGNTSGGTDVVLRAAGGSERTLQQIGNVRDLDGGRWLTGIGGGDDVYDTSTDQRAAQHPISDESLYAVSQGVAYLPYPGEIADRNSIWMKDLSTGATGAVTLNGCGGTYDIQVAGSWGLSRCGGTPAGLMTVVVHLTDDSQWTLPYGNYWLGDGFIVQLADDGTLSWTDLADATHTWQPLGTATTNGFGQDATTDGDAVAVSRTGSPTVAWIDPIGIAHVALLPAASTGTPPALTGPTTPPSPVTGLVATPRDSKVTVAWSASQTADSVRHYVVTGPDKVRHVLDASTTSFIVTGLSDGTPATIALTAINTAGESTPATITATALHDAPPAVANLHVTIDQSTSTAHVTWDYQDDSSHQPARGFLVYPATQFGYTTQLPSTARGLTFQVTTKNWQSQVIVTAVSDYGSTPSSDGVNYTFPGVDSTAPRLWLETTLQGPVTESRDAYFNFDGPDGDDPVGTITYTCTLDGGAPTACETPVSYSGLADGAHDFVVTAADPAGNTASQTYAWTVDTTAPTIKSVSPAHVFTATSRITPRWSANGTGGAVVAYDVQWRLAATGARLGAWTFPAGGLHRSSLSGFRPAIARGTTACLEARAYDAAGNVSAWSTPVCETRLLDDRSLTRSTAGWRRVAATNAYAGTVTTTKTGGAQLTRSAVVARRLAIIATRCTTCGRVGVYVGGTRVGIINLAATTTHRYALMTLTLSRIYTGRLTLRTTTRNRAVTIDAFATSPT